MNLSQKWMPITAGILDVLSGGVFLVFLLWLWFVPTFWPLILPAIFAIVGGIYALRRKEWSVALAGSISAIYTLLTVALLPYFELRVMDITVLWIPVPVGVAAVILTALSKKEFEQ